MTDNATNNDNALKWLNKRIKGMSAVRFDIKERRLRSMTHIINLVVKTLLFGSNVPTLCKGYKDTEGSTGRKPILIRRFHSTY